MNNDNIALLKYNLTYVTGFMTRNLLRTCSREQLQVKQIDLYRCTKWKVITEAYVVDLYVFQPSFLRKISVLSSCIDQVLSPRALNIISLRLLSDLQLFFTKR
jgi:hypothetical protein